MVVLSRADHAPGTTILGRQQTSPADCGAPLDGRFNRTTNKGGKRIIRAASMPVTSGFASHSRRQNTAQQKQTAA